jgi:hypothetical protein
MFFDSFNAKDRIELYSLLVTKNDVYSFLNTIIHVNPHVFTKLPHDLSNYVIRNVETIILNNINNYPVSALIDVLFLLGKLNTNRNSSPPVEKFLPLKFINIVLMKITSYDISLIHTNTSRLLHGLSMLDVPWTNIPLPASDKIKLCLYKYLSSMSQVEVVNCVYCMGKMSASWRMLPNFLKDEISVNIERVVEGCGSSIVSKLLWLVVYAV